MAIDFKAWEENLQEFKEKELVKTVIVTGASGGIGSATAKKFYDNGYKVALLDIKEEALQKVVEQYGFEKDRVLVCEIDVTDEEQVKATIAKVKEAFGEIGALVNIAAIIGDYGNILDPQCDLANFKRVYSVNVFGLFAMVKHTLPHLLETKGYIVNIGSVSGMTGYTCEIAYGSSKWAVIGLTKTIANEYAQYGIHSNSVSPGWCDTNMFRSSIADFADLPDASITIGPMGRPSQPFEMADVVYYLCQKEANFINGANVLADGGMMLG